MQYFFRNITNSKDFNNNGQFVLCTELLTKPGVFLSTKLIKYHKLLVENNIVSIEHKLLDNMNNLFGFSDEYFEMNVYIC